MVPNIHFCIMSSLKPIFQSNFLKIVLTLFWKQKQKCSYQQALGVLNLDFSQEVYS